MSGWLDWYMAAVVFAFGAVVGSFLNVCVHRMPRGRSIVRPPSHCPKCKQPIRWADNIPILSYVLLRGKCRHCGARISPRYVVVEFLTAALFLAIWWRWAGWLVPIYWLFVAGLIIATFIDFEHYIIPDEITLGGCVAGLIAATICPALLQHTVWYRGLGASALGLVTGGVVVYGIVEFGKILFGKRKIPLAPSTEVRIADGKLWVGDEAMPWTDLFMRRTDRVELQAESIEWRGQQLANVSVRLSETDAVIDGRKYDLSEITPLKARTNLLIIPQEAMGLGDVKLMAAVGAFLGWQAVLFVLMFSSMLGALVGLGLIALRLRELRDRIPYGPYIAAAAVVWVFYGTEVLVWYREHFGPGFAELIDWGRRVLVKD